MTYGTHLRMSMLREPRYEGCRARAKASMPGAAVQVPLLGACFCSNGPPVIIQVYTLPIKNKLQQ